MARDRSRGTDRLSFGQIEQLWERAGGDTSLAPTMAAIALAESGGNVGALNDNPSTGDYSVGLWQINYYQGLYGPRSSRYGPPDKLRSDPLADARAAVDLAAGGNGLSNWSTYNSGAYRQYLGGQAVGGGRGTRPSAGGGGFTGAVTGALETNPITGPATFIWNSLFGKGIPGLSDVGSFLHALVWLVNPTTWLRAVQALFGFVLMLVGLWFLGGIAAGRSSSGSDIGPLSMLPGVGWVARGAGALAKSRSKRRSSSRSNDGPRPTAGDRVKRAKVTAKRKRQQAATRRAREKRLAEFGEVPF